MIAGLGLRLALIAIFAAVCFGSGFALGVEWESNSRDALELKRVKEVEIRIQEVIKWRTKIEKVFVDRIVYIQAERAKIIEEVEKHVEQIPDPRKCWLDPERVRVINDAVGAAGQRGDAAAVPADPAATIGKPSSGGALGGGLGLHLPRVLRAPEAAGAIDQIDP